MQLHIPGKLTKRHAELLRLVREAGTISVGNLARRLAVSDETIRRDLRLLAAQGDLVKMHGAVALAHQVGEAPFERRMRENAEAKRSIAAHAVGFVSDGDSLMIDTGTTTSIFAQELLRKYNLTVVTNSADIARTLATVNGNRVYMAGGELNGDNGAAFGASAVAFAASFRVRHAVISIAAIHAESGPMDSLLAEAEFARTVLAQGEHRMILTDSSKFGRTALVKVCDFAHVTRIVTDSAPPEPEAEALEKAGIACDIA
jgi:DeoR family glycerol-3-phosphate regulon repressor